MKMAWAKRMKHEVDKMVEEVMDGKQISAGKEAQDCSRVPAEDNSISEIAAQLKIVGDDFDRQIRERRRDRQGSRQIVRHISGMYFTVIRGCRKKHAATVLCFEFRSLFWVQHFWCNTLCPLQCNSHFFVKNTWNIRYSLTNINLLYLKIYKRHNLPLQKEKNAYLYFLEYFYFPFLKQRLCHLYILGKVDLYF